MMRPKDGFSLLELIIILAIISISAMLAMPIFSQTLINYQLQSTAVLFEKDLRFAKSTANQKRVRVSACISHNGLQCDATPSDQWQVGWIIFIDTQNNFIPKPEDILRYRSALDTPITITSSVNIQNGIQFNTGTKFGKSLGTGLATGYFLICAPKQNGHKFILNIYGRMRKEQSNSLCSD